MSERLVTSALAVTVSPVLTSTGSIVRLATLKFRGGRASLPDMAKVEKVVIVVMVE